MKNFREHLYKIAQTVIADFIPASAQEAGRRQVEKLAEQFVFVNLIFQKSAQLFHREKWMKLNWGVLGLLGVFGAGTAVLLGILSPSATAEYELPPRDTPITEVTTSNTFGVPVGVRIHLQGEFVESWPWDDLHWQSDLWQTVEWQDQDGQWIKVDGWHGQFDTIFPEDTRMVAQRELWATNDHLGTGPFRWKISYGENGRLLQTSDPFYLPDESGDVVKVRLELWPR